MRTIHIMNIIPVTTIQTQMITTTNNETKKTKNAITITTYKNKHQL